MTLHLFTIALLAAFTFGSQVSKQPETAQRTNEITIHADRKGKIFEGMGGNFRLQNPKHDPKVINYCLENLRVVSGRVEMPWKDWQPDENSNPSAIEPHPHVKQSMEMASKLCKKGIPVILSCWFPPQWATTGKPDEERSKWGVKAWRLNPSKQEKIFESLVAYMLYAKKHYGVKFTEFSFNESDLGIDVLFTPEEHAKFISDFGKYMKKRGLSTRLLLGDNSNALSYKFIHPALNNPATYPYIGAVAFHSWDGCDFKTLTHWKQAAEKTQKPLLVTEGSTDAQAWRTPEVFKQPEFAMKEICRYIDICNYCEPQSILQWQYTSDYSLMSGEGLCKDDGPLRPTQRFWNIKQFGNTSMHLYFTKSESSDTQLHTIALSDKQGRKWTIHIANNGEACNTRITGIPTRHKPFKAFITNQSQNMAPFAIQPAKESIQVQIPAYSFVTLVAE